jgi:hypothetical protein
MYRRAMLRSLVLGGVLVGLTASPALAEKKRSTAKNLSIAGTVASSGLIVASALFADRDPVNRPLFIAGLASSIVTPSLGQFYAGEYLTVGMGIRVLAVGLATYAVFNQTESKPCGVQGDRCESLSQEAVVLLGISGIGFIAGMAYDVYDAPEAADRHNKKHGIYVNAARATDGSAIPVVGLSGNF